MKVELINYTNRAIETLLYTKNTRLQGAQSFDDIIGWSNEEKLEHLAYMKDTIQSSWEFVDYTFEISGVTRAFTHQLVRTRTGAYAQESQRTIDASDHEVINTNKNNIPDEQDHYEYFNEAASGVMQDYGIMINNGMPIQDARGILPTNISTSIIAKFSLRTLHDMALLRLCTRTQGEYQRVFKLMMGCVTDVHPWAADFLKVHCAWHGSCAFPRYTECPIQEDEYAMIAWGEVKKGYQERWDNIEHEANPVAKGGMTQ